MRNLLTVRVQIPYYIKHYMNETEELSEMCVLKDTFHEIYLIII